MIKVDGVEISSHAQCKHYFSISDILAIQLPCCETYYSCIFCHDELAKHAAEKWSFDQQKSEAMYCGKCKSIFSIENYLANPTNCPNCKSAFNSNCKNHYEYYFDWL